MAGQPICSSDPTCSSKARITAAKGRSVTKVTCSTFICWIMMFSIAAGGGGRHEGDRLYFYLLDHDVLHCCGEWWCCSVRSGVTFGYLGKAGIFGRPQCCERHIAEQAFKSSMGFGPVAAPQRGRGLSCRR